MITEIKGSGRTQGGQNMNKFETVENVDAYQELANAVVALACDDYRDYKKHFRKNLDLMKYISERMDEIEQSK